MSESRTSRPRLLSDAEPLLLASGSPRRREILSLLGVPTLVMAVAVDESVRSGEGAADYLVRVVADKLGAASAHFVETELREGVDVASAAGAVLVADTSVIDGGAILGKPANAEHAEQMIAQLAGRTHEVWTRFAIGAPEASARVLHAETVTTRVTFRALSAAQVRAYVASGEGTDKAGAYAVQGRGAGLVRRIEGSPSNVVGLPACEVMMALEHLGLAS